MSDFRLPDVGDGLQDAEIVAWHIAVGDHVVADQPLVSVETAKSVIEIPSPRSGCIAAIHGAPGDVVPVGAVLVEYLDDMLDDPKLVVEDEVHAIHALHRHDVGEAVIATPAVRALAAELGVDLAKVRATGPAGAVTRGDVQAAARSSVEAARGHLEPLRGVRRAMEANVTRAHLQVVPATVTDEADIGDWAERADTTVRLVRAIGAACVAEPAVNAAYHGRDEGLVLHDHVDLGVAVDSPGGLFVPVLRDVTARSADDLRAGLDAMKAAVRARSVAPEELRDPTITLSNFGAIGGRHASLVIVPPQVAIVGAGRSRDAAVVAHGHVVVTRVVPLSLTFDHRVVSGGEATRFLRALIDDLQSAD